MSQEGLDLKNAFVSLLNDVGVRKGARTIAEIYFGTGGDSMENLDRILRIAGVSNPARSLVLKRWSQRVNTQVGENLLRSESYDQGSTSDVFEAYERIRESDLKELLMEDLRTRIEERRKKGHIPNEDVLLRKLNKISDELEELKFSQRALRPLASRPRSPSEPTSSFAYHCYNRHHSQPCAECGRCGYHGSIASIPIGGDFTCPKCETWITEIIS